MKRTVLAFLLLSSGAFLRAEESAYQSLVGMARSAASDRGPDAGEIPPDVPRRPAGRGPAERPAEEHAVSVPGARPPSAWTRLFSSLTPSWKAPLLSSRCEVSASTSAAVQAPPAMSVAVSSAAESGELRGLAEYLAVAAAPMVVLPSRLR